MPKKQKILRPILPAPQRIPHSRPRRRQLNWQLSRQQIRRRSKRLRRRGSRFGSLWPTPRQTPPNRRQEPKQASPANLRFPPPPKIYTLRPGWVVPSRFSQGKLHRKQDNLENKFRLAPIRPPPWKLQRQPRKRTQIRLQRNCPPQLSHPLLSNRKRELLCSQVKRLFPVSS